MGDVMTSLWRLVSFQTRPCQIWTSHNGWRTIWTSYLNLHVSASLHARNRTMENALCCTSNTPYASLTIYKFCSAKTSSNPVCSYFNFDLTIFGLKFSHRFLPKYHQQILRALVTRFGQDRHNSLQEASRRFQRPCANISRGQCMYDPRVIVKCAVDRYRSAVQSCKRLAVKYGTWTQYRVASWVLPYHTYCRNQ